MPTCEIDKLYPSIMCDNPAAANIDIIGDKGSVTIDICRSHLDQLMQKLPVQESEYARAQQSEYARMQREQRQS